MFKLLQFQILSSISRCECLHAEPWMKLWQHGFIYHAKPRGNSVIIVSESMLRKLSSQYETSIGSHELLGALNS
jgi:hypothetical protein